MNKVTQDPKHKYVVHKYIKKFMFANSVDFDPSDHTHSISKFREFDVAGSALPPSHPLEAAW